MKVAPEAERRFVLGEQGLWPGRRWKGRPGIRAAIETCRRIQVDPLDVVGRNHDLVLGSRVAGYRRADLDRVLYGERAAYEFGGNLNIYPRERLGLHWSWVQNEGIPTRWERWGSEHATAIRRVRAALTERGPLESREWIEGERTEDYRSRRIEGMALHYLWRRMEIFVHHRERNRKFYDLAERLFGPMPAARPPEETRLDSALETLRWLGISGREGLPYLRTQEDGHGRSKISRRELRQRLIEDGRLTEVVLERTRETGVVATDALRRLESVVGGEVPREWRPLSDEPEAVLLAPFDIVGRDRARALFDFEYVWEAYKPASQRKWGYYVLPVLWGDRLIGRIEPTFDRDTGVLTVRRAWWEDGARPAQAVRPIARALVRMLSTLDGTTIRWGRVGPRSLSIALTGAVRRELRAVG